MSIEKTLAVFARGSDEIIPLDELKAKLKKGKPLKINNDFYVGYSPERVNPGDKEHTIEKIVKVTSGSNEYSSKVINSVYNKIILAGTHLAPSIKVAEAAKVIENAQRDINIAFINELAKIFSKMDIDTNDVLSAASSKWNFLNFKPGLVGGHCIGVDPYYLANKSISMGYKPEIILSGRKLNDSMGAFIADEVIDLLKKDHKVNFNELKVLVLGITFKENCPDYRNTKVVDLVSELKNNLIEVDVFDPWVDTNSFYLEYSLNVFNKIPNRKYNAVILAVAHDSFKNIEINKILANSNSVIYDVKGFLDKKIVTKRL